eukprot:CAMPEP_0183555194 /NCGR_PEP_ID=MMETSP0371-20130417/79339_1 /TAXON_ID=268820 /ORGANISM="Peridinium aciculiferum, Strain PAER-2" /LENGTH=61 /DNA_ID=CAMNT_0025761323 /DNA_START=32 /DNA_END=214 /DNA_ORIENTATION=+
MECLPRMRTLVFALATHARVHAISSSGKENRGQPFQEVRLLLEGLDGLLQRLGVVSSTTLG